MKIYVAGKQQDKQMCHDFMVQLEAKGHTITRDWTLYVVHDNMRKGAVGDMLAVKSADLLVILATDPHDYKGTGGSYAELGIAVALSKPVALIGAGFDECVFAYHPLVVRFSSIEEFMKWMEGR